MNGAVFSRRPAFVSLALLALVSLPGGAALFWGWPGFVLLLALFYPVIYREVRRLWQFEKQLSFYQQLFEQSDDAMFIVQDGCVLNPNEAAIRISGYSKEELDGSEYSRLVAPSDRLRIRRNHVQRIEGELPPRDSYRFRLQCKDGKLIWVQLRVTRLHWQGRPAVVCMLTDIEEMVQQESRAAEVRQLEALTDVAAELARDVRQWLNLMQKESRRLLEAEHEQDRVIAWQQLRELFNTVQNTLTLLERLACMDEFNPRLVDVEQVLSTECLQRVNQRSSARVELACQLRKAQVFADPAQLQVMVQFILDELLGRPGDPVEIDVLLCRENPDEETLRAFHLLDVPYLCVRFGSRVTAGEGKGGRVERRLMFNSLQAMASRNGGLLLDRREEGERTMRLYLPLSREAEA